MKCYLIILSLIRMMQCDKEYLVVNGEKALIKLFPHSAFLSTKCGDEAFICGSSIINQRIILTAAHCIEDCNSRSRLTVSVGHENIYKGTVSSVHSFFQHKNYDESALAYDIALMRLKTSLTFNNRIRRVALISTPPYYEKAVVAGWGSVKEIEPTESTDELYYVVQYVWNNDKCEQIIGGLTEGTFCASSPDQSSYVSGGDSGSALVVRGYIQIGLVSYKMPDVSRSLVVYTDTGYYYNWIRINAKKLYCVTEQLGVPD